MRYLVVPFMLVLGAVAASGTIHAANRPPATVTSRAGTVAIQFTTPWVNAGHDTLSASLETADAYITFYSARLTRSATAASFFPGILGGIRSQHRDAHLCRGPWSRKAGAVRGLDYRVCFLDTSGGGSHPAIRDEWLATNTTGTVVYRYELATHTGDLAVTVNDMKTGLLAVRWNLH